MFQFDIPIWIVIACWHSLPTGNLFSQCPVWFLSFLAPVTTGVSVSLPESRQFLLYARQIEIRGVDIYNPYYNYIISFTVPDIDNVTVVDYDALEQRIYWSDVRTQTIKRAFINGTGIETVVSAGMTLIQADFSLIETKAVVNLQQKIFGSSFILLGWFNMIITAWDEYCIIRNISTLLLML